jgi:hypothetical protein
MSSGAQYVTLQKYFSHPSLVIYFFPTPLIKLQKHFAHPSLVIYFSPTPPIKLKLDNCK